MKTLGQVTRIKRSPASWQSITNSARRGDSGDPSADLGAEEFAGSVVPKHDVSGVKFGGQGELGGDSLAGLRLCHTSRYSPGQLSAGIGAYADNEIKPFFETCFE